MSTAEQLFTSSVLQILVPDAEVDLPKQPLESAEATEWIAHVKGLSERNQAFFDERLLFLLMIRIDHPSSEKPIDSSRPPGHLLTFLNHLQISLEATYISPQPETSPENSHFPVVPARTTSVGRLKPRTLGAPVPIYPPQTPKPTPSTIESDKQYVHSEGTLLQSFVWGENGSQTDDANSFVLLWSAQEEVWIAVYRLSVVVSFVRTNVADPLLCLTVSATLRDKPLAPTPQRRNLSELLVAAGPLPALSEATSPTTPAGGNESQTIEDDDDDDINLTGFEEINLLDGLLSGPAFASAPDSKGLYLPSTRLGPSVRQQSYSLPPISPSTPKMPTPTTARSVPTLRKSFRRTLNTVSGFRVRMRTVFVPYICADESADDQGRMQEAGNEERTVVLCIEVENSGESGAGFAVETVQVSIGGEGAKVKLIGWGEEGRTDPSKVFPLLIRSSEQYNLLYAVTFLRPSEVQGTQFSRRDSAGGPSSSEFQRAVSINVTGRPFDVTSDDHDALAKTDGLSYPTPSFLSRWNCVLDLSSSGNRDPVEFSGSHPSARNVLPNPPSPFPPLSPQTKALYDKSLTLTASQPLAIAGSKRHTFAAVGVAARRHVSPSATNYRASTSMINTDVTHVNAVHSQGQPGTSPLRTISGLWGSSTPNSAGPRSPPLPALPSGVRSPEQQYYPQTPAYPSYPNAPLTPRPFSQAPISDHASSAGPSVEIRRERMLSAGFPQTPGPRLMGPSFGSRHPPDSDDEAETLIVSVALLSPRDSESTSEPSKIYPLDEFMLELFVFNQSSETRRFEVSYPDRKRLREEAHHPQHRHRKAWNPGFMPLENRIRIGPLRPSTCQSARMRFLAMSPGIHSIDTLILTDIESGYAINLRSVMDFVVHADVI